jgi:hypothetical protein
VVQLLADEVGGLGGSRERAVVDGVEHNVLQALTELCCLVAAALGQAALVG